MRRELKDPPKGIRHELLGKISRATLNPTDTVQPFDFVPYQPYYCPVCGGDSGQSNDRMAAILALEFEGGVKHDFPVWSHTECFNKCSDTGEPDVPFD
jgi:hypothetical protein